MKHFQETPERTKCPACGTWHTDANELCPECQDAIRTISYIMDPDFIPYPMRIYDGLPEPHRTEALNLMQKRLACWDSIVEQRKSYWA